MQPSKFRINSNKKKKWPIVVTIIIGSILIIVPMIWIGFHHWDLDKSIAALNLEQQTDSQILEVAK